MKMTIVRMDYDEILEQAKKEKALTQSIEKIMDDELKRLPAIKTIEAIKPIQEYWEASRKTIDIISSEVSRINQGLQHINVEFPVEIQKAVRDDVMLVLQKNNILDYLEESKAVITSEPIRKFLAGQNVIVKNANRLFDVQEKMREMVEAYKDAEKALTSFVEVQKTISEPVSIASLERPVPSESQGMRDFRNQAEENRRHRESLKHQRMLADNTPPKRHILVTILEHYQVNNKEDTGSISIDFYYFNFENSRFGKKKMEMYLEEILKDGFISKYTWHPNQIRSRYIFDGVDRDGIEKALRDNVSADKEHRVQVVAKKTVVVQDSGDVEELLFDLDDGNTTFMSVKKQYNPGTKYRAFLTLLYQNPNMPFGVNDFQKYGNDLLKDQGNLFRGDGDINRVYNQIKQDLKVSKGILFPIERSKSKSGKKQWVWPRK